MSIAFISDLHLEPVDNDRLHSFINFLSEAPNKYKSLYIIGDLFEYWVGDDDPHPINELIQNKIKDTIGQGLSIYFMFFYYLSDVRFIYIHDIFSLGTT